MIPKHLTNEYYNFHIYQAGVYFKKFTPEEEKGNNSWLKNKIDNWGTKRYTYHILQFVFPGYESKVNELAMLSATFAADDFEEINKIYKGDWDSLKIEMSSLKHCTIIDRFDIGGLDNNVVFSDSQQTVSFTSENMGLILDVNLQLPNKTLVTGRFRFLSSNDFSVSPKAIFHP
jgi:hypothetical protein